MNEDWLSHAQQEIEAGRSAEKDGLDGRARVCARRAAGIAARQYYYPTGMPGGNMNFHLLLTQLSKNKSIPERVRISAERLTTRVNRDYTLPDDFVLLDEAILLIQFVQKQQAKKSIRG